MELARSLFFFFGLKNATLFFECIFYFNFSLARVEIKAAFISLTL